MDPFFIHSLQAHPGQGWPRAWRSPRGTSTATAHCCGELVVSYGLERMVAVAMTGKKLVTSGVVIVPEVLPGVVFCPPECLKSSCASCIKLGGTCSMKGLLTSANFPWAQTLASCCEIHKAGFVLPPKGSVQKLDQLAIQLLRIGPVPSPMSVSRSTTSTRQREIRTFLI